MALWEQIVLGVAAVAFLLFLGPSALRSISSSPKGTAQDWMSALLPIALVVAFVLVLILIARS